jgi:hypothetical protein
MGPIGNDPSHPGFIEHGSDDLAIDYGVAIPYTSGRVIAMSAVGDFTAGFWAGDGTREEPFASTGYVFDNDSQTSMYFGTQGNSAALALARDSARNSYAAGGSSGCNTPGSGGPCDAGLCCYNFTAQWEKGIFGGITEVHNFGILPQYSDAPAESYDDPITCPDGCSGPGMVTLNSAIRGIRSASDGLVVGWSETPVTYNCTDPPACTDAIRFLQRKFHVRRPVISNYTSAWQPMTDLTTRITNLSDFPDVVLNEARAINANGQILVFGTKLSGESEENTRPCREYAAIPEWNENCRSFILTPTPDVSAAERIANAGREVRARRSTTMASADSPLQTRPPPLPK